MTNIKRVSVGGKKKKSIYYSKLEVPMTMNEKRLLG